MATNRPMPTASFVPQVGMGLPVMVLMVAIATIVVAPIPAGQRAPVAIGAIIGTAISGGAFLILRPRTMEGFDRDPVVAELFGQTPTWISIPRPLDPYALATAVILGAVLGVIVVRLVLGSRRVRLARS